MRIAFFLLWLLCSSQVWAITPEQIVFPSDDGLKITADLYMKYPEKAPFILLFHRAGWSRGEYRQIAPKLVEKGFNCMAVDLRSGYRVNDIVNETAKRARYKGLGIQFLDAYQDMEAALRHARSRWAKGRVILWGSSYSASLALMLAAHSPGQVDGVIAFSPGEYFVRFGKSGTLVRDSVSNLYLPVFFSSAGSEMKLWISIFEAIPSREKVYFLPKTPGAHGAEALWEETDGSQEYWQAVNRFLERFLL